METHQNLFQLMRSLWHHIGPHRRKQFGLLLILMILVSIAEIMSIGAVLPFLAILTDPGRVFSHAGAQPLIKFMELNEPKQLLLPLTILFSLMALNAGIMRLMLLWASTRLSYAVGAELSIKIYRNTLYQSYDIHVGRNSSKIIDGISNKTNNAIYLINMALNLISSSVMLIAILVTLLSVEPIIAIASFGGFGLIYLSIIGLTRKRLLHNSRVIAHESTNVIKSLQEGLGGIRDVLIDGSQESYCKIYSNADQPLRRAQGNSSFISSSPRSSVEALGTLLIAALAYALAQQSDGLERAIPILGALALGAQRLLPALQQAYGSWSALQTGQVSLKDALDLLDQPLPFNKSQLIVKPISYQQRIDLRNISFRYSTQSPWILKETNLCIQKGSRVGFIGTTGSGKSTMLDIIMGLLRPTDGALEIDGNLITPDNYRAWQAHIAHVPQSIYLADSTIEENIAFGIPEEQIDYQRVRLCAKQARIAETIETLPLKYKTYVGERGVRLSGGQRQRIGIARALYKQADVIIFDEATSALDNETEQDVMHSIESLNNDITLLIIAHRLTTLKSCTQIFTLHDGVIEKMEITKK